MTSPIAPPPIAPPPIAPPRVARELYGEYIELASHYVEHALQVVHRDLVRLLPCRGGGDNALDALPEPRRQRSRDDDALIERLRHRMRAEGARERGKAHVAAALALARADPAPVPTRDDPWWNDYPEVGRGSRYLVGTTYKADVQRLLPSLLHPPAPPRPTAATPPPAQPSPPLAPPRVSCRRGGGRLPARLLQLRLVRLLH